MTINNNLWLLATSETQGTRQNDFNWCDPFEPVTFGFECDGEDIDGGCGCRRSMCGVNSLKATTTMIIAPVKNRQEIIKKMISNLMDNWNMSQIEAERYVSADFKQIDHICSAFVEGTVLEKRGEFFRPRTQQY